MFPPLPLLWLSLTFLAGILLGSGLAWSGWGWSGLAVGCVLAGLTLRRLDPTRASRWLERASRLGRAWSPLGLAPLALLAAVFAGAARFQFAHPPLTPSDLAWYNDRGLASVRGLLAAPPDERDRYSLLTVQVQELAVSEGDAHATSFRPVRGRLIVRVPAGGDWRYADRVELTGLVISPPENEDFSYRDYLAHKGILSYLPYGQVRRLARGSANGSPVAAALYALREQALAAVGRMFPAPESALMAGILLGNDNALPAPVVKAFQDTGTAHIIAISGFNISILAGLFTRQFSRILGRARGALAAAAAIAFYVALVGGGAAVIRAAIMGVIGILGQQVGRRQMGVNTLAATSAVMCLFNPDWLWEVSFQLSFFATLGLVLYAEPLQTGFLSLARRLLPESAARRLAGPVGEYVLFTMAAQATTLPLMAVYFGGVSWVAFLANPLVLPPQPAVMQLGGLAVLLGLIFEPVGQVAAWLAWPFAAYTLRVVEWFGAIPHPTWDVGSASASLVGLYYALLFGLTLFHKRIPALLRSAALRPALLLGILGALAVLVWQAGLAAPDGRLRLTLLDTGSAETLLIQTPTGRRALIGGGPSASRLAAELDRRKPFFARGLDLLVVARTQAEAIDSLPRTVERYRPAWVLWSGDPDATRAARSLDETLLDEEIPVVPAEVGQAVDLGGGAKLRVVSVGKEGVSLLVEYDRFRALLIIGEPPKGEVDGPVTALLLGGGAVEGLEELRPRVVLVSGKIEDPEALEAVQGWPVLSTGQNGWIEIVTDGEGIWVEAERR